MWKLLVSQLWFGVFGQPPFDDPKAVTTPPFKTTLKSNTKRILNNTKKSYFFAELQNGRRILRDSAAHLAHTLLRLREIQCEFIQKRPQFGRFAFWLKDERFETKKAREKLNAATSHMKRHRRKPWQKTGFVNNKTVENTITRIYNTKTVSTATPIYTAYVTAYGQTSKSLTTFNLILKTR